MSHDETSRPAPAAAHEQTGSGLYVALTIAAAMVAASAAQSMLLLALPPWAMFMGWVAYFSHRPSAREGAQSFVCVLIGLCIGALTTIVVGALAPTLGGAAFPITVFGVALVVIATRGLPILNNLLGYFIGLITFFASHFEPEVASIARLGGATALGSVAGWIAQSVEHRIRELARA
jgi:hypothetical protein